MPGQLSWTCLEMDVCLGVILTNPRLLRPRLQCAVNLASANEAELAYAPLLLAIDDGSRYVTLRCDRSSFAPFLTSISPKNFQNWISQAKGPDSPENELH